MLADETWDAHHLDASAATEDRATLTGTLLLVVEGHVLQDGLANDEEREREEKPSLLHGEGATGRMAPKQERWSELPLVCGQEVLNVVVHAGVAVILHDRAAHEAGQEPPGQDCGLIAKGLNNVGMALKEPISTEIVLVAICSYSRRVLDDRYWRLHRTIFADQVDPSPGAIFTLHATLQLWARCQLSAAVCQSHTGHKASACTQNNETYVRY